MRLGDRTRDEQAEPGPGLGLPCTRTAELLEDQPLVFRRDPWALVLDRDANAAVLGMRSDVHVRVRGRVLDGVVDEVLHDLPQSFGVTADRRQRGTDLRDDAHLVLADLDRVDDVVHDAADVDVAEGVAERPGLDSRRVEDVADQVGEPRRLVADQREERLPLVGRQLAPPALQRPRRADHGRHRTA